MTTQPEWTDEELVAMPRVNVDLMDRVLDYIIANPDEWNQGTWANLDDASPCGTTFCFAGHACALSGEVIVIDPEDGWPQLTDDKSWWETGQGKLGLTDEEADALFVTSLNGGDYTLPRKERQLQNVKVQVEKIRHRAKLQEQAFNRIAQEFIDAAGLDDVVKPGYECPESAEAVQRITGGERK